MKKANNKNILKVASAAVAILAVGAVIGIFRTFAITGPTCTAGGSCSAIVSDSGGDIGIGTQTTQSNTKLLIVGSTTNSSAYGLQVWNSASNPLFTVRNDGAVSIPGAATISGVLTATINASNISSGQFMAGNFSFQGNVSSTGLCLGGTCQTSWSGIGSQWTTSGTAIYYNDGSVGIGTASPTQKLEVAGNTSIYDPVNHGATTFGAAKQLTIGEYSDNPAYKLTFGYYLDSGAGKWTGYLQTTENSAGSNLLLNPNQGNVGIGTTNPLGMLSVKTGTDQIISAEPGSSYGGSNGIALISTNEANNAYKQLVLAGSNIILNAAGGTGNVGIGTTSPNAELMVNGIIAGGTSNLGAAPYNAQIDDFTATGLLNGSWGTVIGMNRSGGYRETDFLNYGGLGAGGNDGGFRFYVADASTVTPVMTMLSNGMVGIGTIPNDTLEVGGNIGLTNNGVIESRAGWLLLNGAGNTYMRTSSGAIVIADNDSANVDIVTGGGKVGIGTNNPGSQLTLQSMDNGTEAYFSVLPLNQTESINMSYNHIWEGGSNGNNALFIDSQGSGSLVLQAVGGTGAVGIGTVNPKSTLSVGGDGYANTGVYGNGSSYGVYGSGYYGVYGYSSNSNGNGVVGIDSGGTGVYGSGQDGVSGTGDITGVYGTGGSIGVFGSGYYGGEFEGNNLGVETNSCSGCSVLAEMAPVAESPANGDIMCTNPDTGKTEICATDKSDYIKGIAQKYAENIMRTGCSNTLDPKNGKNSQGIGVMNVDAVLATAECKGWYPIALSGLSEQTNVVCASPKGKTLSYGDILVSSGNFPGYLRPLDKGEDVLSYQIAGKADSICASGNATDSIEVWIN